MLKLRLTPAALLLAAFTAIACVTINVYFPEAAVKDLSEKIEDAVKREAAAAATEGAEPEMAPETESAGGSAEQSGALSAARSASRSASRLRSAVDVAIGTVLHFLAPAPVYAQESDVAAPEITNPAIRKIVQTRAARVRELNRYKAAGALGENNQALVEVRQLDALALPERAQAQKLVRAENADRESMFKEIAAATGADLSQLPQIRETYATTLRENARKGDWIQMPDGSWRQK